MKRVVVSILLIILVAFLLCSCGKCEEHEFQRSKYRVEKAETCISDGVGVKVCGKCGYEEETTIHSLGHKYVKISTTQTCTKSGTVTYECSACKDTYSNEQSALGHQWIAATCKKAKYCSVCGVTEGGKGDHNFIGMVCNVCGAENTKTVTCKGVNFIVPIEVTANDYSAKINITDITITYSDVYDSYSRFTVEYSVECLSGNGNSIYFNYSLYDKEGYVVSSGFGDTKPLKTGDKTRNESFHFNLPHISGDLKAGETYKLVISDSN